MLSFLDWVAINENKKGLYTPKQRKLSTGDELRTTGKITLQTSEVKPRRPRGKPASACVVGKCGKKYDRKKSKRIEY